MQHHLITTKCIFRGVHRTFPGIVLYSTFDLKTSAIIYLNGMKRNGLNWFLVIGIKYHLIDSTENQ